MSRKEELLASPSESFQLHIRRGINEWNKIKKRILPSLTRLFRELNEEECDEAVRVIIGYHDVGKLTKKWQKRILEEKRCPPHATLGALSVDKALGTYEKFRHSDIVYAASLATCIHHIDRSIIGANLEYPDEQLILAFVTNFDGSFKWHERAEEAITEISKEHNLPQILLFSFNVSDLREISHQLRKWSRTANWLENHKRRLKASALHHILKLCDVRAASERKDWAQPDKNRFVQIIKCGGLVC